MVKRTGTFRPKLSFGFGVPIVRAGMLRMVFPFKRSWPAIVIVGAFAAVMCVPLVSAYAMFDFSKEPDLFRLVMNIFMAAWTLGWLAGVSVLGVIFLGMLLGREEIVVQPGIVRVRLGIPGIGIGGEFDATGMRNLRTASPDEKKGVAWRGPHLAFDWGGRTVRFGSHIDDERAKAVMGGIETALGVRVPTGVPAAQELETDLLPSRRASPDSGGRPSPAAAGSTAREACPGSPEAGDARPPVVLGSTSTIVLVAANLVPLAGVLFLDWRLGDVMVLYWAESAVVGVFNVFKMAVIDRVAVWLAGPFFLAHFGGFMAIHFLFVYVLFVRGIDVQGTGMPLSEVADMFVPLWPALLALVVSHGFSFFANFLGRREYAGRTLRTQMHEPYTRIIIMHVTIILGGFIVMGLKTAMPVLVLLIAFKIAADAKAHVRQHVPRDPSILRKRAS
jgi:hypothetical protein